MNRQKVFSFLIAPCLLIVGLLSSCLEGEKFVAPSNPNAYYTVSLDNNAVFYGRIVKEDRTNIVMNAVHYIQRTPPNPNDPKKRPGLQLIKQATDPTMPKDEIVINRQHVLLYQELREDSPIVVQIKRLEEQYKKYLEMQMQQPAGALPAPQGMPEPAPAPAPAPAPEPEAQAPAPSPAPAPAQAPKKESKSLPPYLAPQGGAPAQEPNMPIDR